MAPLVSAGAQWRANQNVERRDRPHDSEETACACDKR